MGCCCSNVESIRQDYNMHEHEKNDFMNLGEIDGHKFIDRYFDKKHEMVFIKCYGNRYITARIIVFGNDPDIFHVYMFENNKGQKIMYDRIEFNKRMKIKYLDDMRNRIREEIRREEIRREKVKDTNPPSGELDLLLS